MEDKDEIFGSEEDGKQSVPVAIAVLRAKVELLTYFVKNVLVWKHEFEHVKMIAYSTVAIAITALGALALYFLKSH